MDNLQEVVVHFGGDGLTEHVGSTTTYEAQIKDSTGRVVGRTTGTIRIPTTLPNGHPLLTIQENVEIGGGTLQAAGACDLVAMQTHEWINLVVVGTGGRYAATTGSRQFQVIRDPVLWRTKITLWRSATHE